MRSLWQKRFPREQSAAGSRGASSRIGRRLRRLRRQRLRDGALNWAIKISAPDDSSAARWGDTAFAQDLAEALQRIGQSVMIHPIGTHPPIDGGYDVILVLRGLHRIDPVPGCLNYLWIISHPDAVSDDEAQAGWSRLYAASRVWSRAAEIGAQPLLQAASARRFDTTVRGGAAHDVLFVGTSRGLTRPVIRDALEVGADLTIYGHDWERFAPAEAIAADNLPFKKVPAVYAAARIILNDHWADMREHGFLSNRLFDATFSGARVISDPIDGLELFGGLVQTYEGTDQLRELLVGDGAWPTGTARADAIRRVRDEHSFDTRAATLLAAARQDLRLRRR